MGKARNLADLLDDNGDVKSASLDNVPASNNASALTTGTLPIARIGAGTVTAAKVAADVATQAELDTVSTVASAALPKAGGTMTGNITTSTGSPLSYNLSSDYLIHKDAAQVVVTDNSSDGETWLTMKTFVAVKSGKLRFRWDAYIQSGTYYWAGEFHKNGTLMKKSDNSTDAHHNYFQSLASGFSDSVHNYRTFQMDLGDVLPGDVITYKMASATGAGSIQSGSGQNLFCKNFEAYSSTPTVETHSALPSDGKVLQQQRVYLTSATQLTSSGAMHELSTALRVSITPNHANNLLLLECSAWYCSPNTDGLTFAKFYDVTNSATVFEPPAHGSRDRVHFAQRVKSFDVNDFHTMNFRAIGTAGNTNARTYTIYHRAEAGTIQFLSSALSTGSGVTAPIVFTITEIEA